jgi:CheY-like chemotaxis protein
VLVVDDDPKVRMITARMLEAEEGLTVLQAGNGDEALGQCATHQIAVVVTDMVMPRMDGRELGRQVKARWPDIKLLFVTGFADIDPNHLPGHLMVKPYPVEQLVGTVQALADSYWSERDG